MEECHGYSIVDTVVAQCCLHNLFQERIDVNNMMSLTRTCWPPTSSNRGLKERH